LRILTSYSLDTLRVHLYSKPRDVKRDLHQLSLELDLKFVEMPLELNTDEPLGLLGSRNQPVSEEVPNVLKLRESLSGLPTLLALDERLWVTLTLSLHREYFLSRWFDDSGDDDDARKTLDNHLFATTNRRFIRDQALSRLWWAGKIASDLKGIETSEALETIFWNSELLSQLTSRPTTASSSALSSEVVRIMHLRKTKGLDFDRDKFRKLMAALDLALGRNLMFSLPAEVLRSKVEQIATAILES